MKYPLAIIVFFNALLMGIFCYSQESSRYRIERAVIKNLSQNIAITSVIEDTHGFLWLGTSNGLYRYDGYKVQSWLNTANDSNSLSHNYVLALAQDKEQTIWAGTFGAGLNCIDYNRQIIFRIKQSYIGTSFQLIKCILRPQKETGVWVASPAALLKLSAKGVIEKQIQLPESTAGENGVSEMIETKDGNLFVLTEKDFLLVNTKSGISKSLLSNTDKLKKLYKFKSFISTNDGTFILAHQTGIYINNPSGNTANNYDLLQQSFANINVSRVFKTSDDQIWIATNKGLFEYDQSRGVVSLIAPHITDALKLYEDSNKVLWVATSKNGLYRISKPPFIFHTIAALPALIKNSGINKILEETDSSWLIATDNNLVRWLKNTNRVEIISTPVKELKKDILSVFIDRKKNMWITTRAFGAFLKKSTASQFQPVRWKHHPQSKPAPGFIIDFFESGSTLWAAYYSNFYHYCGLFYYDSSSQSFLQATSSSKSDIQLIPAALSDVKMDTDSNWWASTWNAGLFKIVNSNNTLSIVRNFNISSPPKNKLSLNIVSSLILSKTGDLWMGTIGGGINQYQIVKDTVIHYSLSDGLPSNVVYRLEEDEKGNIWVSTDNGICKLDKSSGKIISFNNSNGLPFTSFNFLSSLKARNGLLAFGTVNGNVVYFHPDAVIAKPNRLKTVITEINLGNESLSTVSHNNILKRAAFMTDTLMLSYIQSSVIAVSVSNLNLINPDIYAYSYMLEGFDENWTTITDRNTITYTNLDPGIYTLLLKNSNHYGIWNEKPDKLVILIHPPYWRTWWFVLLVIAALASLVYWFFRYRLQQQLKVLQVRNKLHRDLHDDVGATLSSVKAYSEILLTNPDNAVLPGLIKENAHEMIERLEVIAWATNPAHDSFSGLHHQISKWAIPLFHTNNIHLYIDAKGVSEQMVIPGEIRQNIYLIAKEALNNCLKYAQASNCSLQFLLQQGKLIMKVTDNGVGLTSLIQGGGNGIKNMKRRAEEMGGTLEINTSSAGTAVILMVPTPFRIPKTWDKKANG